MKKKVLLSLLSCFIFCLSSCNDEPEVDYVKFFNYDGSVLWKTEYYDGMILTYGGETPSHPSDDVYDYSFLGWNHSFDTVKDYRNYYALFDKTLRSFSVTFKDFDNSIIKTVNVPYGGNANVYAPSNPVRQNSPREHYCFSHWNGGDLTYVVSDMVCNAVYSCTNCYEVKFYDYDGQLVNTEFIEEGKDSDFKISSYRKIDERHFYVFDRWDVEVTNVQQDLSVNAVYKIVNGYDVTFLNYDGSQLCTVQVPEGYAAIYSGQTPCKPSIISGKYKTDFIFSGWDKQLDNVHCSFSVNAQFNEDYYNYVYVEAVNDVIDFCKSGLYGLDENWDHYVYENVIKSGFSGVNYEYTSFMYDPSDKFCSLICSVDSNSSYGSSRSKIRIYFPKKEPGTYRVYYTYHYGSFDTSGLSFFGTTSFTSYTENSIYFDNYTNLGGTSLSTHLSYCSSLINKAVKSVKDDSRFNYYDLGFR